MITTIPAHLHDTINVRLDEAFKVQPLAAKDRAFFYNELLRHYDELGYVPEFDLVPLNPQPKELQISPL